MRQSKLLMESTQKPTRLGLYNWHTHFAIREHRYIGIIESVVIDPSIEM